DAPNGLLLPPMGGCGGNGNRIVHSKKVLSQKTQRKGAKKQRFSFVGPAFLLAVGRVGGHGSASKRFIARTLRRKDAKLHFKYKTFWVGRVDRCPDICPVFSPQSLVPSPK